MRRSKDRARLDMLGDGTGGEHRGQAAQTL